MIKRPIGFTLLSLLLAWLSIAGFFKAFIGKEEMMSSVLTVIYGITALAAAIGFWKMKKWSFAAYLLWCATVLLMSITMQLDYRYRVPIYSFLALIFFIILLLSGGAFFIHKKLKNIIGEQNNPLDHHS